MIENKKNLEQLRTDIDAIDLQLIQILQNRFVVVGMVGQLKQASNIPPLDEIRWKKVLESRTIWAKEIGLDTDFVEKIFKSIHDQALKIEKGETK